MRARPKREDSAGRARPQAVGEICGCPARCARIARARVPDRAQPRSHVHPALARNPSPDLVVRIGHRMPPVIRAVALSLCPCARGSGGARAYEQSTIRPNDHEPYSPGTSLVDHHALQPIARGYEDYVPGRVRKSTTFSSAISASQRCGERFAAGKSQPRWNTTQRFAITPSWCGPVRCGDGLGQAGHSATSDRHSVCGASFRSSVQLRCSAVERARRGRQDCRHGHQPDQLIPEG